MNMDIVILQVNVNVVKVIKDHDVINVLQNLDVEMEHVTHQNHILVNVILDLLVNFVINQLDHPEPHVTYPINVLMVDNVFHPSIGQLDNTHVNVQLVLLVIIAKLTHLYRK